MKNVKTAACVHISAMEKIMTIAELVERLASAMTLHVKISRRNEYDKKDTR